MKKIAIAILLAFAACKGSETRLKLQGGIALALASGGNVSSGFEDFFPQVVRQPNNFVTLFFVSNRAGSFAMYVSQSVGPYAENVRDLPPFSDPVTVKIAGNPITSPTPITFAAFFDPMLPGYRIIFSDPTLNIRQAFLPSANLSTGNLLGPPVYEQNLAGFRAGLISGADARTNISYITSDGGATLARIQAATPADAGVPVCSLASNCRSITYIKSSVANALDFLHTSTDGRLYASRNGVSRAAVPFNTMLANSNLRLTGLSSLGHGATDLLIVSASDGTPNSSDLFVMDSLLSEAITAAGPPPPAGSAGAISAQGSVPFVSTTATRVYGNTDFVTALGSAATPIRFANPHDVTADLTGVYVADQSNARIVFFPGISQTATRVYGQANNTSCGVAYNTGVSCTAGTIGANGNTGLSGNTPGVYIDATGVYVTDIGSHRILFYSGVSTSPTRVYGQAGGYLTGTPNNPALNADSLNNPQGVTSDATGVYIADNGNHRVLFYPGTSTTATRVYGQGPGGATFNTGGMGTSATALNSPRMVHVDSTGLYVGDLNNNRIVFFPGTSVTATRVYGQYGDFACSIANRNSGGCAGGSVTASTLNGAYAVATIGDKVYISDGNNNRILGFVGLSTTASFVIGQGGSFTSGTANLGTLATNGANSLSAPRGIKADLTGLYVADIGNNRVLFYPVQ